MDPNALRLDLIEKICRLPSDRLGEAAEVLRLVETRPAIAAAVESRNDGDTSNIIAKKEWPHAPVHRLSEHGTYMVTAGTLQKAHVFHDAARLDLLEGTLLALARAYGWHLEAWAVFSNHYHFVGHTLAAPARLREFLTQMHANVAREVNRMDGRDGRQVWHNYWDKHLTFEKSYLARLNYVHQNAVKHGLVRVANQYPWCSAAWFERSAKPAQGKTIYSFKIDRLQIADDFEPLAIR